MYLGSAPYQCTFREIDSSFSLELKQGGATAKRAISTKHFLDQIQRLVVFPQLAKVHYRPSEFVRFQIATARDYVQA